MCYKDLKCPCCVNQGNIFGAWSNRNKQWRVGSVVCHWATFRQASANAERRFKNWIRKPRAKINLALCVTN